MRHVVPGVSWMGAAARGVPLVGVAPWGVSRMPHVGVVRLVWMMRMARVLLLLLLGCLLTRVVMTGMPGVTRVRLTMMRLTGVL